MAADYERNVLSESYVQTLPIDNSLVCQYQLLPYFIR